MGVPAEAVFAVIGEGVALLKTLDENDPGFFDSLSRLREILAMVGGSADSPAPPATPVADTPLGFSLSDPDGSAAALRAYMATGLSTLPAALAVYEAQTVADLASMVGDSAGIEQAAALFTAPEQLAHLDVAKVAAFGALAARGVDHGLDSGELRQAVDAGQLVLQQGEADNPAYAEARAEYNRISRERTARAYDLRARIAAAKEARQNTADPAEQNAARALQTQLEQEYEQLCQNDGSQTQAWEQVKATSAKFQQYKTSQYRALYESNGKQILGALAEASPISQEQATAWANSQVIDDNARAKLRRLGYKPEDVIRDMADFYRLSGGKASAIRIAAGGRRASASNISARLGEKIINLGTSFNRTVLFHELAHHLENDPIAKAAAQGFLIKRREGEKVYRLRDLTGIAGYKRDEIAYKDSFTDPYVGKVYSDGATEVFSMGVQYLANPTDAAIFAGRDPEMFNLVTGYLSMAVTPAMRAKLDMHADAISDKQDAAQAKEEQYAHAIAWLAAREPIEQDGWYEALEPDSDTWKSLWRVRDREKSRRPQYVGSNGDYKVFSGTYRNGMTRRNGKGYMVVNMASADGGWTRDEMAIHGSLEDVQAAIGIARAKSIPLSSAFYNYLAQGWATDRIQNTIDLVAGLQ